MAFRNNIEFLKKQLSGSQLTTEEKEKKSFSENGRELGEKEKIMSEYIRLTATLAFDCDLEFEEYKDVNKMVNQLGELIEQLEEDEILYDSIKKMIVYLDLQIQSKVSFYSTFIEMLLSDELKYDYNQLKKMNLYDFKVLLTMFYKNSYKKFNGNKKELFINEIYNINNNYKNIFNNIRLNRLIKSLERTKKIDLQKYSNYKNVLFEVISKISELDIEEDIIFVRKIIAYLEYNLNIEVDDKEIIVEMFRNNELNPDFKNIVFGDDLDLEYFKEKFHYEGQVFRIWRKK